MSSIGGIVILKGMIVLYIKDSCYACHINLHPIQLIQSRNNKTYKYSCIMWNWDYKPQTFSDIMNLIAYYYSFFDLISHIPCIQKTFLFLLTHFSYNYVNEPKIITITGVMVAILQWKGVPEKLHRYFLA